MKNHWFYLTLILFCALNTTIGQEKMEVDGAIIIKQAQGADNGTIEYDNGDFRGKTSTGWKSLTSGGGTGLWTGTGTGNDIKYAPSPLGKVYIGGTTGGSMLNINGSTPSMLRLQNTSPNGYMQFYSSQGYIGYIGIGGGDKYLDIAMGSDATGIQLLTTSGGGVGMTMLTDGRTGFGTVPLPNKEFSVASNDYITGFFKNTNQSPYAAALEVEATFGYGLYSKGRSWIDGKLKIGDDIIAPEVGEIRYNSAINDFEGYNGTDWISLTKSNNKQFGINKICENETHLASDGDVDDLFGYAVAISDNYAIISARDDENGGGARGSVYIFQKINGSWSEIQKLHPTNQNDIDHFGNSVDITDNYAIVGVQLKDHSKIDAGSVYIYHNNGGTWIQQQVIENTGATEDYEFFGASVAITDNYAIAGKTGEKNTIYNNEGSAYVYKRNGATWTLEQKLTSNAPTGNMFLGRSIDITDNYAVVGTRKNIHGTRSGSAVIFKRTNNNWNQQQEIYPSDGAAEDLFAEDVALTDNYILVGAWQDDDKGSNSGSAYIFERDFNTWTETIKLLAPDGAAGDGFGNSVDLTDDYALIGSPSFSTGGSAYVFSRSAQNWFYNQKLNGSDTQPSDGFGGSVSLTNNQILIGASGNDDDDNPINGDDRGSIYFY